MSDEQVKAAKAGNFIGECREPSVDPKPTVASVITDAQPDAAGEMDLHTPMDAAVKLAVEQEATREHKLLTSLPDLDGFKALADVCQNAGQPNTATMYRQLIKMVEQERTTSSGRKIALDQVTANNKELRARLAAAGELATALENVLSNPLDNRIDSTVIAALAKFRAGEMGST